MILERKFDGFIELELVSADIPHFLSELNNRGIHLYEVNQVDGLTVITTVHRSDQGTIENIGKRMGVSIKLKKRKGFYWNILRFSQRSLLLGGLLLMLFLVTWLPTRVLFIEVEGNATIPDKMILEQAQLCGITFGASRREVRSEKMKNSILAAIPELQWAGVNTVGCTAVITVKERTQMEYSEPQNGVSSIIAVRDGVVESCTGTKGNLLCKTGQAVKAGEVLISGYTDCGITIKATRAAGEVFAQTTHKISVITPLNYQQKGESIRTEKKYSLLIGKKQINFYKDSGISDAVCDKMYLNYYLTLPGGFQLPFGIQILQLKIYNSESAPVGADNAQAVAGDFAERYLLSQMISGRIITKLVSTQQQGDFHVFQGHYVCSEMIGRVQTEETIDSYGKDN